MVSYLPRPPPHPTPTPSFPTSTDVVPLFSGSLFYPVL